MPKFGYQILCIIIVYVYIYAPSFQVMPFGIDKVILLISYVYITCKRAWNNLFFMFKNELSILLLICSFSFIVTVVHSTGFMIALYDFLLLVLIIPCPYALCLYFGKSKIIKLDRTIIICASIASFISLCLIMNPELAQYMKTSVLKYPEELLDRFSFRGYGLSDGLLFSYPVIQGFCTAFIILGFARNPFYFIFILPLLVSIFTNARSGLIPIFVSVIILLFVNTKQFLKILTISVVAYFILMGTFMVFLEKNEMLKTSFEWGMSTFDIVADMFEGKKSENVEILLGDMVIFPERISEWIMGSGNYIYTGFAKTTDIGYLLRLNYGGLIYLLLFFVLAVCMFIRLRRINNVVAFLLFASLIYLNFKGDFFIVNSASRFFFFIYVICIMDKDAFRNRERKLLGR